MYFEKVIKQPGLLWKCHDGKIIHVSVDSIFFSNKLLIQYSY